jgi:hypothetical protein
MSDGMTFDPLYIAARRVLLDALSTLAPHGKAIVVVAPPCYCVGIMSHPIGKVRPCLKDDHSEAVHKTYPLAFSTWEAAS